MSRPTRNGAARQAPRHRVQSTGYGCVVACVAMVLEAAGLEVDVDTLHSQLRPTPRGVPFANAAVALAAVDANYLTPDPTDPKSLLWLRAQVHTGALVIAQVFSSEMAGIAGARALDDGPHGALPATFGWLHAIVVADTIDDSFVVYDPWFD